MGEHGDCYLDCAGYCVFLLGHRHPAVVAAVQEQLALLPVSSRVMINGPLAVAATSLAAVAPSGLEYVWFGSSGAEAVEAALKLAIANGRSHWISMEGGYHGKSLGALSVSGRESYRAPFASLLPKVDFLSYGDAEAIEDALAGKGSESAVIMEPLQSEAGVIIPPPGYLKAVSDICHRHGALLIVDEISTGLGRTGAWWRCQTEMMEPDILLAGKALGGGVLPVSALIATAAAFRPFNKEPLLHTSTFSGNPLGCAAVVAALSAIRDDDVIAKSQRIGARLRSEIQMLSARHEGAQISAVRGAGLLIGIEFHQEHQAADFILELMSRRILVSHSLNAHKVVRLTPPSTLTDGNVNQLLTAVAESLAAIAHRHISSDRRYLSHA
ncbi:MAG: aminotransferase class III-fold pyridoxal phosphate-dependent enzyme [Terracidiphilus sp.]